MQKFNFKTRCSTNESIGYKAIDEVLETYVVSPLSPIKKSVEDFRTLKEDNPNYQSIKRNRLQTYYFNCAFKTKLSVEDNILDLTNDIFLDIDHIGTQEELRLKQKQISLLPFVKACYMSCSGKGLHVIVSIEAGLTIDNFKDVVQLINVKYFNNTLDKRCFDVGRQAIISYDPKAYINLKCTPLDIDKEGLLPNLNLKKEKVCLRSNPIMDDESITWLDFKRYYRPDGTPINIEKEIALEDKFILSPNKEIIEISIHPPGKYKVVNGNRNATISSICRTLFFINPTATVENMFMHVMQYNTNRCMNPLPEEEVMKIVINWDRKRQLGKIYMPESKKFRCMVNHPKLTRKEKRQNVQTVVSKIKVDKTKSKIHAAIEELANEGIIITRITLANRSGIGRSSMLKYFKEFKDEIEAYNKLNQK